MCRLDTGIRLRADDVVATLNRLPKERGSPAIIQWDNGSDSTSVELHHWCYWNQVRLNFSRPGKPNNNAAIESYCNSFRRECLNLNFTRFSRASGVGFSGGYGLYGKRLLEG